MCGSSIWRRASLSRTTSGPTRMSTTGCTPRTWSAWRLWASTSARSPTTTCSTGGRPGSSRRSPRSPGRGSRQQGRATTSGRQSSRWSVELESGGRLLVFALGSETSGIPPSWAATERSPGVELLDDLSPATASRAASRLRERKRPGDVAIASIHWGTNWGYEGPSSFVHFAHRLVDAGFDVIHGHSSHHVRPIEVYRDRLILYGCGDFIDDYEGIEGYEAFRDDLALMYFATLDAASGELAELR